MKRTETLPGGEAARLAFCRLMLEKPNVLLVTHDHDVVHEVASRIWSFADGGIEDFKGPYEEFREAEKVA